MKHLYFQYIVPRLLDTLHLFLRLFSHLNINLYTKCP